MLHTHVTQWTEGGMVRAAEGRKGGEGKKNGRRRTGINNQRLEFYLKLSSRLTASTAIPPLSDT